MLGSCSGSFFALDRATGALRWSYDTRRDGGAPSQFHGAGFVTDDLVVTPSDGSGAGLLYAFDRATGAVHWKLATPHQVTTDLLRHERRVIARQFDGTLLWIDLTNGVLVRTLAVDPSAEGSQRDRGAPVRIGSRILTPDSRGGLLAVEAATGEVLWRREIELGEPPLLGTDGQQAYFATSSGRLLRVSPGDGAITAELPGKFRAVWRPQLFAELDLAIFQSEHEILATDRELRTIRWRLESPEEWTTPAPIVWRDALVVGTANGALLGLDPTTGATRWRYEVGQPPRGLSAAGDLLVVGTIPGRVLALAVRR